MTPVSNSTDRFRSILVVAAVIGTVIFNSLAAAGRIGGVTPDQISDKYTTLITPAGYAFAIWSLIYFGIAAFSVYQLLPSTLAKYRSLRQLFIITCVLNCGWILFWHNDQILICFIIILLLLLVLFVINYKLIVTENIREYWLVKAPFSIYFGWVTAATLVNFAVLLSYLNVEMSASASTWVAVGLITIAMIFGVIVRFKLTNHLYPLAIAWALTAIGVKQSGQTLVVAAAAIGTVVCLVATLSVVVSLPSRGMRNDAEI